MLLVFRKLAIVVLVYTWKPKLYVHNYLYRSLWIKTFMDQFPLQL